MDINLQEILDNSPMFQSKLQAYEERNKALKNYLEGFNKVTQQYKKACEVFNEASDKFADYVLEYSTLMESNVTEQLERDLGDELNKLGSVFKEIVKSRQINFEHLDHLIIQPMKQFFEVDIKNAKISRKKLEKLTSDFNSAQIKYLNTAPQKKKSSKIEEIFHKSEEEYMVGCLDLVTQLHSIKEKNKFEFVERMFAVFYTQISFFHTAHEALQSLKLSVTHSTQQVEEVQSRYNKFISEKEGLKKQLIKMLTEKRLQKEKNKKLIEKTGYLYTKTGSMVKDWKKRYFIIKNHEIYYVRNSKDLTQRGKMNLLLCSVKMNYELKRRNCFEISNPNSENKLYLQAPNEEEVRSWIEVINNNIGQLLNLQQGEGHDIQTKEGCEQVLQKFYNIPGCDRCADCGTAEPEWCSINLGITFCIDCSGSHRSLGIQISKVRSLTLDSFEEETIEYFRLIGNDKLNKILESNLGNTIKPTSNDSFEVKNDYIIRKYSKREFIGELTSSEELNNSLYQAIIDEQFFEAYTLLISGANSNYIHDQDNNMTHLHTIAQSTNIQLLELLILFDANPNLFDTDFETPIHYAVRNNSPEMIKRLLLKKALIFFEKKPSNLFTNAYQLSLSLKKKECTKIILQFTDKYTLKKNNIDQFDVNINDDDDVIDDNDNDDDYENKKTETIPPPLPPRKNSFTKNERRNLNNFQLEVKEFNSEQNTTSKKSPKPSWNNSNNPNQKNNEGNKDQILIDNMNTPNNGNNTSNTKTNWRRQTILPTKNWGRGTPSTNRRGGRGRGTQNNWGGGRGNVKNTNTPKTSPSGGGRGTRTNNRGKGKGRGVQNNWGRGRGNVTNTNTTKTSNNRVRGRGTNNFGRGSGGGRGNVKNTNTTKISPRRGRGTPPINRGRGTQNNWGRGRGNVTNTNTTKTTNNRGRGTNYLGRGRGRGNVKNTNTTKTSTFRGGGRILTTTWGRGRSRGRGTPPIKRDGGNGRGIHNNWGRGRATTSKTFED
ncbi:centaurin/arf [Anaeramoeba flamelloides]|uniref:Centaurin/arf n=1 Tax=Anaeramoeba flamelloides TaxID=1746091 RepID=A0AAV7ZQ23_9EUKA|nr:centaurin/arf [Anaeramoeba flamelloides]